MLQIIRRANTGTKALVAIFVASLISHAAVAAEQQTINAFAIWEGQGVIYETGVNMGTFVGSIAGRFFIETDRGPLDAGRIVCPVMLDINLLNAMQNGRGKCTITAEDGAQVFGDWSCHGVHLIGCDGEMTLTGGTGRLAGTSGSGEIRIRSTVRRVAKTASSKGSATEFARGILLLHRFTYTLPSH